MAEIWITTHEGKSHQVPLGDGELFIGRDPDCDLHIDDAGVSRRHACVKYDSGRYVVEDLGSKNGTQVNGQTLPYAFLSDGDILVCGTRSMIFREPDHSTTVSSVVLTDPGAAEKATRYASIAREPVLPQRRLQVLYELSDRLTTLRDMKDLLEDAMDICFDMFQFERGAIGVRPPERRNIDWPVIRNATGAEGELTISRTIVARALEQGERSVLVDADMAQIDPTVSMVQHGIRSALCVPLEFQGQILGVIYGDRTSSGACYADEDMDFLAGLAKQISIGLVNSRLHEEQKLKLQLENEIALARDIQQRLFPSVLTNRPDMCIAAVNDPGRQVSGDYYDSIELPDNQVGILIADVTGKGVASSLLMANLQAAVRVTLQATRPLGDLLCQWNELIYRNTDPGKFVTCLAAVIDPTARTVRFASAGHFRPYLVRMSRSDSTELPGQNGLPLGIDSRAVYVSNDASLGDAPCTLFVYTDGVVEAMNAENEFFEWNDLIDAIHQEPDLDPQRMVKRVRAALSKHSGTFPQSDDITMIAVHLP